MWIKLNNAHESTMQIVKCYIHCLLFLFWMIQTASFTLVSKPSMHTTSINLQSDSTNRDKLYFVEFH